MKSLKKLIAIAMVITSIPFTTANCSYNKNKLPDTTNSQKKKPAKCKVTVKEKKSNTPVAKESKVMEANRQNSGQLQDLLQTVFVQSLPQFANYHDFVRDTVPQTPISPLLEFSQCIDMPQTHDFLSKFVPQIPVPQQSNQGKRKTAAKTKVKQLKLTDYNLRNNNLKWIKRGDVNDRIKEWLNDNCLDTALYPLFC